MNTLKISELNTALYERGSLIGGKGVEHLFICLDLLEEVNSMIRSIPTKKKNEME
jgi:hypothetical protein